LDRLAGGTFYEIVEGRDGYEPAGALIDIHTDVAIVRPFDVTGIRHNVFRESDETIVLIKRVIEGAYVRERQGLVSGIGASFYLQHDAGMISVSARTATARYADLAARGEKLVTKIRRQQATQDAIAEGKRAVQKAEAAANNAKRSAKSAAKAATDAETVKAALRARYPGLSHVTVEVAVCADCP